MSANIISPSDAGLVLHRLVTERVGIIVWFVSVDTSVRIKIDGFITSFERRNGLAICSNYPSALERDANLPPPVFMMVAHDAVVASSFAYTDETQVDPSFEVGFGLRINLPNGDTLTIMEKRDKKL